MKKLFLVSVLCLTSFLLFAQATTAPKNKRLPSVAIKDVKGNPFNTGNISNHGKPIIISFWATWCKPCVRELTTISDVYSEWVEETGVKLYAISVDDSRSMTLVAPLVNGKGWEYMVLLDPNSDFKRAMN